MGIILLSTDLPFKINISKEVHPVAYPNLRKDERRIILKLISKTPLLILILMITYYIYYANKISPFIKSGLRVRSSIVIIISKF